MLKPIEGVLLVETGPNHILEPRRGDLFVSKSDKKYLILPIFD